MNKEKPQKNSEVIPSWKRWDLKNPGKRKESAKRWRDNNPEKRRQNYNEWIKNHSGYKRGRRDARLSEMAILKNKPCVDCGGTFPPVAMDFDHIKGEKLHNVSQMLIRMESNWASILKEIEKCELVCANCHRVRTANRKQSVRKIYRKHE